MAAKKKSATTKDAEAPQMSKEETIGFHKGALNTLMGERAELARILNFTENLIQAHAGELEKLGVKLDKS
tara:strand:- start:5899 stop:6108 length:210 start_codon:yes stop_codon:yes gene_type:complete